MFVIKLLKKSLWFIPFFIFIRSIWIMQHNIQKHNQCHKIDIHQIINKFVQWLGSIEFRKSWNKNRSKMFLNLERASLSHCVRLKLRKLWNYVKTRFSYCYEGLRLTVSAQNFLFNLTSKGVKTDVRPSNFFHVRLKNCARFRLYGIIYGYTTVHQFAHESKMKSS